MNKLNCSLTCFGLRKRKNYLFTVQKNLSQISFNKLLTIAKTEILTTNKASLAIGC